MIHVTLYGVVLCGYLENGDLGVCRVAAPPAEVKMTVGHMEGKMKKNVDPWF